MSEPKFREGDTIIIYGNTEEEFVIRHVWDNHLRLEDGPVVDGGLCKVVFRPASREETEALRRVAKAACDYQEAHDSYFEEAEAWVAAGRPKDYPTSRLTPTFRAMLKECRLMTDPNNEKYHEEL